MLLSVDFSNLHTILETLYDDMLPLCEDMMDVGKGIAGLGALFYVAMRVWQSLAHAEPVDVYPLLLSFRHRHLYPAFPHTGSGYYEQRTRTRGAGYAQDAGGTDAGYGTVP